MPTEGILIAGILGNWVWPILQFVIGLGLVVFFHELGHFLVAKWVGIRVDRFAIGFGPRLFGIRRGETEYRVCALPLGGYVAMAGQEDFAPQQEGQTDPRAFCNKSIGARFAVISAGVVMNIIFAAVLFVIIGLVGKDFQAPIIGGVDEQYPAGTAKITWEDPPPGQPAETTGLRGGDKILKIEGDSIVLSLSGYRVTTFQDIAMTAALADEDNKYVFTIERQIGGDGKKYLGVAEIGVRRLRDASMFAFGIARPVDVVFGKTRDVIVDTPFDPGDRVVRLDGKDINGAWEIGQYEKTLTGDPVTVTVRRGGDQVDIRVQPRLLGGHTGDMIWDGSGQRHYGRIIKETKEDVTILLEDGAEKTFQLEDIAIFKNPQLEILGMIPRLRVLAVQEKLGLLRGSPAKRAGLQPGDVIVGYGDRGAPTLRQLLDMNQQAEGTGTNITVLRDDQQIAARITPKLRKNRALTGIVPTVDIASTIVAGVSPGSAAAEAGIEPGMVVEKINDRNVSSWVDVYQALTANLGKKVTLTCRSGIRTRAFTIGPLDKDVLDPGKYTYQLPLDRPFRPLLVKIQKTNPLVALGWGCRETLRMILSTYVNLRSMILGNVSRKALIGPLGIGRLAIQAAQESPTDFVYLLAFVSAAIAVFNFLPLPVLDGGHALFLLIEKIRGRPIPAKVMNIIQVAGLVLLLGVFLAVTWQDISRIL